MIAGLPWSAWLLILAAVVPGLALAVLFHRAHGGEPDDPDAHAPAHGLAPAPPAPAPPPPAIAPGGGSPADAR